MIRSTLALAVSLSLLAGCSSSSTSPGTSCTWQGTYAVTPGAARSPDGPVGLCPDMSTSVGHWSFSETNGHPVIPAPSGSAPADTTSGVDTTACTSHGAFRSSATPDQGCTDAATVNYDLAFTAAGFTGTYTLTQCDGSGNAPIVLTCTYDLTAVRQ